MVSLRRRRIKMLTMEDFKGRREAIERRGRELAASWRGFFYLTEVAAIATEKLTMADNNGVVATAIPNSSDESNFNLRSKRSPTTRPAISMNEEDSVLNAKKKSKTASVKTSIHGNKKEDGKRVKQEKRKVVLPNPPPDLPQEFKNRIVDMEGREVTLVIQKPLFETDLKKGEGRLSIPANQIQSHNFLTDEEKESLNKLDERGKLKAIEAKLIGPNAAQETTFINFKKWNMKKSKGRGSTSYVLTTKWNNLVENNPSTLKLGNVIQLWSFRQEGQLCCALVVLIPPVEDHQEQ